MNSCRTSQRPSYPAARELSAPQAADQVRALARQALDEAAAYADFDYYAGGHSRRIDLKPAWLLDSFARYFKDTPSVHR